MKYLPLLTLPQKAYNYFTFAFTFDLILSALNTNIPTVSMILSMIGMIAYMIAFYNIYLNFSGKEYTFLLKNLLIFSVVIYLGRTALTLMFNSLTPIVIAAFVYPLVVKKEN